MSKQHKPEYSISATNIGPIFSLKGTLANKKQNLILARNGIGKSFLSRAFLYLDLHGQEKALDGAPGDLVSDEALGGKGEFSFSSGGNVLGSLKLDKSKKECIATCENTIFHVFSEDFVQKEMREKEYNPEDKVGHQITIDSENIELADARIAHSTAKEAAAEAVEKLSKLFEKGKKEQLSHDAGVNKKLTEYRDLKFDNWMSRFSEQIVQRNDRFAGILKKLTDLKNLPTDPVYPAVVSELSIDPINFDKLSTSLTKETSPSRVSDDIKEKIDAHEDFFRTGLGIREKSHRNNCPFCEQGVEQPAPKAVIDAYVKYFADEEAKHKSELGECDEVLKRIEGQLADTERKHSDQKLRYDALKTYLPSMRDTSLVECAKEFEAANAALSSLKKLMENKKKQLAVQLLLPSDLKKQIGALNKIIRANNLTRNQLVQSIKGSDEERKGLHREACIAFAPEFASDHQDELKDIRDLHDKEGEEADKVLELEEKAPSDSTRDRIVDSFQLLLKEFFADKYIFDKESYTLKRETRKMERGPHRTLSEGEKTAIVFCYFLACIHRKVQRKSDYSKVFLVFDDPVTSMSHDFMYTTTNILKNLSLSEQGGVSINPSDIGRNGHRRPKSLILTHNSYFFNLLVSTKVVKKGAAFSMRCQKDDHEIIKLDKYVAPFQEQLKDIYEIVRDKAEPNHTTANTVRSVLEAIGRFCRPDKSFSDFLKYLRENDKIAFNSALLNNYSHGSYYDETPTPDDLKMACKDTIAVVEKRAYGHIKILEASEHQ